MSTRSEPSPSPTLVPAGLTAPSAGYRARVVALLVGLVLFVLLYASLIAGTGWLILELWRVVEVRGRLSFALLVGGTGALALLLVFLVKGLFKRSVVPRGAFVEVTRDDEPALFAFLDRLVEETGAPRPKHVYLSPDVNAAVFYDRSLFHLVWPTRKNLVLGYGLLTHLTRSELKAVLAHELGHFAQRAMKLGSYVYVANQIVLDAIHGRDAWDELVEQGKRADLRIALFAWVAAGLAELVRMVLRLAFHALNLVERSLSREMELAADRVAVSVSGSRAIARGLYKAELADACFQQAIEDLMHASDHGMLSDDIYHHQERSLRAVRQRARRPTWGELPEGDAMLFEADTLSKPSMWASHPPSAERERAARVIDVPCEHDERPASSLLADPERTRKQLTIKLRETLAAPLATGKITPAEKVQRFIDDERSERLLDPRYGQVYTARPLGRMDVDAILAAASAPEDRDALWRGRPEELSARIVAIGEEAKAAVLAKHGQLASASLRHRGFEVPASDADRVLAELEREADEIDRELHELDARVLDVHARMARAVGPRALEELGARYRFQLAVEDMHRQLVTKRQGIEPLLLAASRNGDEAVVHEMLSRLSALQSALVSVHDAAKQVRLPALANLKAGRRLSKFLFVQPIPAASAFTDTGVSGDSIRALFELTAELFDKLLRLREKGIGAILAFQERLAERFAAGEVEDQSPSPETIGSTPEAETPR